MAVPGPITSAVSVGCHALIRARDAECVTSATEILELVSGEDRPSAPASVRDRLSHAAQRVLDALDPFEFRSVDQLAAVTGEDPASLDVLLDALCNHDLAVCTDSRYRLSAAAL